MKTWQSIQLTLDKEDRLQFYLTSKFDFSQFCIPLSHTDAQYLIWKSSQFLNGVVSSQEHCKTIKVFCLHSKIFAHLNIAYLEMVDLDQDKIVYNLADKIFIDKHRLLFNWMINSLTLWQLQPSIREMWKWGYLLTNMPPTNMRWKSTWRLSFMTSKKDVKVLTLKPNPTQ